MTTQNQNKWPELLSEIVAVFDPVLKGMIDDPSQSEEKAEELALALAKHMGGRQVYLPKATELEAHFRSEQIFAEFTGDNITALSRKYGLSEPRIYQILSEQRIIYKAKQPTLFH